MTIPRLQRFYGGHPGWWLAEAPIALVRAFIRMLPRLDAEEQIAASSVHALGSGAMEKKDRERMLAALRKAAGGKRARAKKASVAELAVMGIGVSHG